MERLMNSKDHFKLKIQLKANMFPTVTLCQSTTCNCDIVDPRLKEIQSARHTL